KNAADTVLDDKLTKTDDANRIITWLLEARRNEKNYIIRADKQSAENVDKLVVDIISLARDLKGRFNQISNQELADSIISSAEEYKQAFDEYLRLKAEQDKAETEMVDSGRLVEKVCQEALADQRAKMENAIASATLLIIAGAGVAVLLGALIAFLVTRAITRGMVKGVDVSQTVAQGDLSVAIEIDSKDEIGQLLAAMKKMVEKLTQVVSDVGSAAANVSVGSQEMSAASQQISQGVQGITSTSQQVSQGATEQASSIEEVSSTIEQATANIKQNADNAMQTEKIAMKAAEDARQGGKAVVETVTAMKEIAGKISIIEEIARQTNLLALNAAIEAARAGEYGKGFAVVASEVRKLAERSQKSAGEISQLSISSVEVANRAGQMLERIIPDIQKTAELVQEISAASKEQSSGIEQINKAIMQLEQVIQQNASASEELSSTSEELAGQTEETASTAEELAGQAEQLQSTIAFFRVNGQLEMDKQKLLAAAAVPKLSKKGDGKPEKKPVATGITLAAVGAKGRHKAAQETGLITVGVDKKSSQAARELTDNDFEEF
ncbi:MAG: methyl-accepting chemotaxis protein, partial [Spirochaetota bacterium]